MTHLDWQSLELWTWLDANAVDWGRRDRLYWKALFKRVRAEGVWVGSTYPFACQPVAHTLVANNIRQWRNLQRRAAETLPMPGLDTYGALVGWLQAQLDRMVAEVPSACIDNLRWARRSSQRERRAYRRAVARGLNGAEDRLIVHPETGECFFIGCNYGH